jgi:uncharacterized protein (TIGR02001 family)
MGTALRAAGSLNPGLACRKGCYNRPPMAAPIRWKSLRLPGAFLALAAARGASAGPGGMLAVTSDYVFRGVSQTQGNGALQADLHWDFPRGVSAGAFASQVEFLPHQHSTEIDGYLQWHGALDADFDLGASATHYGYPGDPRPVSYDYNELGVSLAWRDQLRFAASWIPSLNLYSYSDGLASHRQVFSFEAGWHRDLLPALDLSAGVGFYDPTGLEYASYGYGDLTLGLKYGHWRMNVAWIWVQDSTHRQYSLGPAGGPLTVTLAWAF